MHNFLWDYDAFGLTRTVAVRAPIDNLVERKYRCCAFGSRSLYRAISSSAPSGRHQFPVSRARAITAHNGALALPLSEL